MSQPQGKQVAIPSVTTDQTCDFAEKWKWNGIFVALPPAAMQFATDWANIVLASFIEEQARRVAARKAAIEAAKAAEAQTPTIVLTGADS